MTSSSGVADEDLTARARIRNAALRHFTEYGFDRSSIRDIAAAAGVSSGLVRHHFGSRDQLRDDDPSPRCERSESPFAAAARMPRQNSHAARYLYAVPGESPFSWGLQRG